MDVSDLDSGSSDGEMDEFEGRDEFGLKTSAANAEVAEMKKYGILSFVIVPIFETVFGFALYFLGAYALNQKDSYAKKFKLVYDYQAGYMYLAVYMLSYLRQALVVNANGARAPARVDRPDQHVYKVMASSGPFKDAPYVMMVGSGPQGRFNRAQRGVFNTDEVLPLVLAQTALASFIFGPMVCVLLLLVAFGRIVFACKYKQSGSSRLAGFLPSVIGEKLIEGLLIVCIIKGVFYPQVSF